MARRVTSTFVHELPLKTSWHEEHVLRARWAIARRVQNAILTIALRRADRLRQSRLYRAACRLEPDDPRRNDWFQQAKAAVGFTDRAMQDAMDGCYRSYAREHLDIRTVRAMGTRAYDATKQYLYGKKGRPKFLRLYDLDSIEGSDADAGLRWRDGQVKWSGLTIPALLRCDASGALNDRDAHALNSRCKYVRIIRRQMGQRERYFVQLVLEGVPLRSKHLKTVNGPMSLDLGVSSVAITSPRGALLVPLAPDVVRPHQTIRRLQRHVDRQRKANNPDNYDEKGRAKKGARHWHRSKRQQKVQAIMRDTERRLTAGRQASHGQLVHQVLQLGNQVTAEKVSVEAWQKSLFGKSIGRRAPGMFSELLVRNIQRVGGSYQAIPLSLALSQMCVCGRREKKPLSERVHRCSCGLVMQRDLLSAYLAGHCVQNATGDYVLQEDLAREAWSAAGPQLHTAWRKAIQASSGAVHNQPHFGSLGDLESEALVCGSGSVSAQSPNAVPDNRESWAAVLGVATSDQHVSAAQSAAVRGRRRKISGPACPTRFSG